MEKSPGSLPLSAELKRRQFAQKQVNNLTDKLKEIFVTRSKAYLKSAQIDKAFTDLENFAETTGDRAQYLKEKLKMLIELEQIDEVVDFLKHSSGSPELEESATKYICSYNKENVYNLDNPIMERHMSFIRWVKEMGGDIRRTRLMVYAPFFRGLNATTDIPANTEIVTSPISLSISSKEMENTPLGKLMLERNTFDDHWRMYIFPIVYFLDERNKMDSKYKPWLDVIPRNADDHPMFFNAEERNWLKGSSTLKQLEIERKNVEGFYKKVAELDSEFAKRHSIEEFLNCYYVLCSRFFGLRNYTPRRAFLIPYSDMVNTGTETERNATWEYDPKTEKFTLVSTAQIQKGKPLCLCYGHNSNFTYFTYYGFTLENEDHNAVGFVMPFDYTIKYSALKEKMLHQELTHTKLIKFYEQFKMRRQSNQHFLQFFRFYYWEGSEEMLYPNVSPKLEKQDSFEIKKRKGRMNISTIMYERVVLSKILALASEMLGNYGRYIQDECEEIKKKDIEYKKKCSLIQVIGEKKSLKVLIEMCEFGLKLLSMKTKKEAEDTIKSLQEKPVYLPYILEELMKAKWE